MGAQSVFLQYVADNYKEIEKKIRERLDKLGLGFDHDVFYDTLLKCDDILSKKENISENDMMGYLWSAMKINMYREMRYARNCMTDEITEEVYEICDEKDETDEKFKEVSDLIVEKFGKELYSLFLEHACGKTYEELIEKSGDKKLKYKFRCIREYVRRHFLV